MGGFAVDFGIDGDGNDAHIPAGADNAAGDFPAVGDEDFGNFHENLSIF